MPQDKVRVYALARELNMESKDLLDLCRQHGLDLKNQLSSLDPDQRDLIEQLVKKGPSKATAAPPTPPTAPTTFQPFSKKKIDNLDSRKQKGPESQPSPTPPVSPPRTESPAAKEAAPSKEIRKPPVSEVPPVPEEKAKPPQKDQVTPTPPPVQKPVPAKPEQAPQPQPPQVEVPRKEEPTKPEEKPLETKAEVKETPQAAPETTKEERPAPQEEKPVKAQPEPVEERPVSPPESGEEKKPATPAEESKPAAQTPPPASPESPPAGTAPKPPTFPPKVPTLGTEKKIRDLGGGSRTDKGDKEGGRSRPKPRPVRPPTPNKISPPPPLNPKLAKEPSKPQPEAKTQKPLKTFSKEMLEKSRQTYVRPEDLFKEDKADQKPMPVVEDDEESGQKKPGKKKGAPGGVGDRKSRKAAREQRAEERRKKPAFLKDSDEDDRPSRGPKPKREKKGATPVDKKGRVTVELPITVRSLSEALGVKSGTLLFKLLSMGLPASVNINSSLEPEVAEEIAMEQGTELEIKRPPDAEDQLLAKAAEEDDSSKLVPRAPIVTVMGHVDHGKTSLLDKIRRSNVVATEAGGITQVIRAWRVEHDGKPITFLDTPGHEAFTKMRARGAQVTDIAVIVVAADDGIVPQPEDAINHSKAAGVSLVISINKVDLPNANVDKARQQLYGMEVLPDNMGGDTPFVETSAATGMGIDDLLDNISLVAELKELKANPSKPGKGICLEAMLSEGEGVQATLLVQNGTLRKGDVILCGAAFGRIRQMYNDLGRAIEEAGPSVPVRITGLDEVPNADDPFIVAPDLATAQKIADKRKLRRQEAALAPRTTFDLSRLGGQQIAELKVILKADFRGSIEAIRKELEKLKHEEVTVKVLHAAIGGISESDVQLALTSPEDTVIVGFNVVPDDRAKTLAEEKGISLQLYNVIYELTNDIKAALEGKLKPRQEIVNLGRAVVRDTFKISRVGTIAGCYVTQGIIKRSAKVRVIREGVIVYPPGEKTVGLDSLKRFKDDVAEVREGFECGIKISGYDDIKSGDVIEAYRVEEVQRTLDSTN